MKKRNSGKKPKTTKQKSGSRRFWGKSASKSNVLSSKKKLARVLTRAESTRSEEESELEAEGGRLMIKDNHGDVYKESEWYAKHKWKVHGVVDLKNIAHYMAKKFLEMEAHQAQGFHKGQREAIANTMKEVADFHAETGGDTVTPRLCTLSFRGEFRGVIFSILKTMKVLIGENGDVHAMNGLAENLFGDGIRLPEEWRETFGTESSWDEFDEQLGIMGFDAGLAPEWLVLHWGVAALHCAKDSATLGKGVIIFKWNGFIQSDNCRLEFLFCKCLVQTYKDSVYIMNQPITGAEFLTGRYMKKDEALRRPLRHNMEL